jgi:hypothetical protein
MTYYFLEWVRPGEAEEGEIRNGQLCDCFSAVKQTVSGCQAKRFVITELIVTRSQFT